MDRRNADMGRIVNEHGSTDDASIPGLVLLGESLYLLSLDCSRSGSKVVIGLGGSPGIDCMVDDNQKK